MDPTHDASSTQQSSVQKLALFADSVSTLLHSAEVWSQVQAQAIQRSGRTWRLAAEQLRTATQPADLICIPTQIFSESVLQFVQFTQDLLQATAAAQPAAVELAREETKAADTTLQHPVMQAWQAMVNPLGTGVAGALNGASATH